jgi:hypothetical protein
MIRYIKQAIRTWKFTKLIKQDIKDIYGKDYTYQQYLNYIQSEKFEEFLKIHKRDKQLNQLL